MAGISFDVSGSDRGLRDTFKDAIDKSLKFEKAIIKAGEKLDASFDAKNLREFGSQLEIQRKTVAELEKQYQSVKKTLDTLGDDKQGKLFSDEDMKAGLERYNEAKKLAESARKELDAESASLDKLEKGYNMVSGELGNLSAKQTTYMTQIRQLKNDLQELAMAGKSETAEYKAKAAELERVGTAYNKVNKEAQLLTKSGSAALAGMAQGITGLAGAFSAGQGVMSLFVKDNEKLAAIQTKLQAAMAITIGLQQVSNTLHATSPFRIAVVNKATAAWTKSQTLLNTQLKLSIGLSRALMFTGVGLLIAGATAAYIAYDKWNKKQKETNRLQQEFKDIEKSVASSMAESKVKVDGLLKVAASHEKSIDVRRKAVERLNELMPDYNGYIDQEGRLIANTDEALKKYLSTLYKVEKAKKLMSDKVRHEDELESLKIQGADDVSIWTQLRYGFNRMFSQSDANEILNNAIKEKDKEFREKISKLQEVIGKADKEMLSLINDDTVFKELFGDTSKQKTPTIKKEIDNTNKIASELLKIRQDNEQREIDLMEEGEEKRLKQLELNFRRELDKIEEIREAWTKELGDLSPEQEAALKLWEEMSNTTYSIGKDNIKNEGINKANEEFQSLLDKYQDFNARKLAIDKEYQADLNALEKEAVSPERDAAINELKKRWKEALSSLNLEEFQDSIDWSLVFGNLDRVTTEELSNLRDKLKEYLSSVGDSLSPTDFKTITDTLDDIDNKLSNRQPITELKDGYEEYKKAVEDVTKAKKELAKYEEQTPEYVKAAEALKKAESDRFATLSKMTKAVNEMGRMGGDIVNSGNEIVDMLSSLGFEVGESVSRTLDGVGQIMSGLEKINLNEPFSVVTGSITALTGLGKTIGGLFGLGSKDNKLFKQIEGYEKLVSLYDQLIDKQKEYLRNLTGGDLLKQVSETEELIRRKEESERKKLQSWLKTGASANHHSMGYRINRDLKKELESMGIKDISEALSFDAEKWKEIQKNIDVWEKLPEEVRNYAQAVIDAKGDTESLAETIKEINTQTTFDGLRDGFKSTLLDMKSDAKSIASDLEKIMQEAMINSILDEEFNDWLKDWRNKLNDSMTSGGKIDKDEYKALQEEWQRELEKKLSERDAMMDMFGWGKEHSQDTSRGYSTTMDQETGGAVLGMTRGIFESLEQSRAIMIETSMNTSEINSTLKGFTSGFNDLLDLNIQQTFYQAEIAKLSKALPLIEKTLGKIEKHTSKL